MSSEPENPIPDPHATEKPRPLSGDGGQARAESELWELDGEDNQKPVTPPNNQESDGQRRDTVRKWVGGPLESKSVIKKENRKKTLVRLDIHSKGAARPAAEQIILPPRGVEKEFSQLEDWVEDAPSPVAEPIVEPIVEQAGGPVSEDMPVVSEADLGDKIPLREEEAPPSDQERVKPSAQEEKQADPMKGVEWAGLVVLAVLVAALGIGAYLWSIHLLPEETPRWQKISFPVKGKRFEIKNATTYWRSPVVEGPDKDPIRRGTRLIPVIELDIAGGPAALRLIFRDEEGRGVGDPIIRNITSSGKLALAATAGFEDPGMHAAYRTEELDPWSVEVSEAVDLDASGSDFSQILKMNLSPDLR